METMLKVYYNGTVFVPMKPVDIQAGKVLVMTILHEDSHNLNSPKQMAAFMQITNNLHNINDKEPLSAEFDNILLQRIRFKDLEG